MEDDDVVDRPLARRGSAVEGATHDLGGGGPEGALRAGVAGVVEGAERLDELGGL